MSEYITNAGIRREVERIRSMAGDDEAAHGAEDRLYKDVLRGIAEGKLNASAAKEALKAKEIDFARWCA